MTFARFFGFGFLTAFALAILKIVFFSYLDPENIVLHYVFWFFTLVVVIAFIRRLGFINYLESIVVLVIWLVFSLFMDLLIASPVLGLDLFKNFYILFSYLLLALGVFLFHKKRHIQIRRQKASK